MTHQETLDLILSYACPYDCDGDVYTYIIDLHCHAFEVKAKKVQNEKYEIISCKKILKELAD